MPSQTIASHRLTLSALSLAIGVLLSACGGGDASAPDTSTTTPTTPVVTDTTPPTVNITNNVTGTTASGDVTFTFTFSEDVGTSFTSDDIVVTGGTKGTFTLVSGTQATLVVSLLANSTGTITVSVGASAFTDAANNANATAISASQAYSTVTAQVTATTLVSFDESTAPVLTGFGGSEDATVVADPTNAANKVAKIVKSATADTWAGATVSICPSQTLVTLPFSATNTKMSARVWSPEANIPVRLKVENASDGTKSVETEATVTTAAGWQTLTFDFANPATGTAALNLANTYNKASVFFNFGKSGAQVGSAKTYYLDDLKFVGSTFTVACPSTTGSSGSSSTASISFDETTAPVLSGFGGAENATLAADPTNAANKVLKVVKTATAESWAGTTISNQANLAIPAIDFSSSTVITARVWSPDANIPVRLKVEDASDPAKSVETDATVTTAAGWQTLSFNFTNQATGTSALNLANTYNKLSVFFNFGKTGAQVGSDKTYYLDDVNYKAKASSSTSNSSSSAGLPITFDNSAVTYTLAGFGGAEDATLVTDPVAGAANGKVAKVVKSATAETWAGTTFSTGSNNTVGTLPFSASAKTLSLKVWTPAAGTVVRLKVEDAADPTHSVETDATTTVAGGWETLTFNFANQATGTSALNLAYTYNRISVFFNFGKSGAAGGAGTYYFDQLSMP